MNLGEFTAAAAGVRFVKFGRDFNGWDCWGLVWCAYRIVRGVELPGYLTDYADPNDTREIARLIDCNRPAWRPVDQPAPMDIVLMRIAGAGCHVGLVIAERTMLHVHEGIDTVTENLHGLRWRDRIDGYYAHEAG